METKSSPLVSIIIPAYNSGYYLPDAIKSCLAQTYQQLEIIVVDDGSTDDTHAAVNPFPDVTYLYQDNAGPACARNTGIHHATGTFLQFLDADDILLPTKIERCMAIFTAYPDTGLVYTGYELRSEDLKTPIEKPQYQIAIVPPGEELAYMLNTGIPLFGIHCALTRTELIRQVNGFDESLTNAEDWHLWVKLAAQGTIFRHIGEKLVWYRHTGGSLSGQGERVAQMRLRAYQHLRDINLPPHFKLEAKIAGRHHALAMKLWEKGERTAAREQFRQAIATHPTTARRLLLYATYGLSASFAGHMIDWLGKWKPH